MAEQSPDRPAPDNQGESVGEWVSAPAGSHLGAFRLIDRSGSEYGASSNIEIRFNPAAGSSKPSSVYEYTFSNHDQARAVFDALSSAGHPGEVVDKMLVKARVPYIRLS